MHHRAAEQPLESTVVNATALPGLIGAAFAMSTFAIAIVAGLGGRNDALTVLSRAVTVLLVGYPIGLTAGVVVARVVRDHVGAYVDGNPIPELQRLDAGHDDDDVIEAIPVDDVVSDARGR